MSERRIALAVTPSARRLLTERGYDSDFGARPLKRLIQKTIADPVAILILEGKVADGGGITVDVDGEEFVISAYYSAVD